MTDVELESLTAEWLSLQELAERIGEPLSKVRQLVREGRLATVEVGTPPARRVPGEVVRDGHLVKGLAGVLTVLRDGGYSDREALRWLLSEDPVVGGRPVDALAEGHDAAVNRRARLLAF